MPTKKKPYEEPSISPPNDVLEAAKKYPIMGFTVPVSGPFVDTVPDPPGPIFDGTDPDVGGPLDTFGDQPGPDGGSD
jgi:hypothetical protein